MKRKTCNSYKMMDLVETLALRGYCVISPVYLSKSQELYTEDDFGVLREIHFQKALRGRLLQKALQTV